MFQDKFIFSQLASFLDRNHFNYLVHKYSGAKYVKHFTCWNQLQALMFSQLCNRESLRDLIVALEAHRSKCYHLGMGRKPVAKTIFAIANQNRDYRIFEDFAFYMMDLARKKRVVDIFKLWWAMCMPSTLLRFHSACRCSGGQSFARRKAVSRFTSFTTWRHLCQRSSISRQPLYTIPRQWIRFYVNQAHTMYLTVATMRSNSCIVFIK